MLLFAAIGEIFAERSGVLNLGVEGMMLDRRGRGLLDAVVDRQPLARARGGDARRRAAQPAPRGRDDPPPGGPGRLRPGADVPRHRPGAGARRGPSERRRDRAAPAVSIPLLSDIPVLGPDLLPDQSILVYVGYLLVPLAWFWINRRGPASTCGRSARNPAAADALGINVYRPRYATCSSAACWPGSPGRRSRSRSRPAGSASSRGGQGWIAVGLVIFAQWSPFRARGRRLPVRGDRSS